MVLMQGTAQQCKQSSPCPVVKCSCQEQNILKEQQPKNYQEVSGSLKKSQEMSVSMRNNQPKSKSIMKQQKLSRSLCLESCTTLRVMDCLAHIAPAVAALAIALKL